jgi:hypothetical protein
MYLYILSAKAAEESWQMTDGGDQLVSRKPLHLCLPAIARCTGSNSSQANVELDKDYWQEDT